MLNVKETMTATITIYPLFPEASVNCYILSGLLGQESQELSRLNLALAFSVPCIPSFLLTPPDANVRLGFFQHLHQYRGAESCSVF